jgi:autotransporter translocation and assembly factor TamB
MKKKIVVVISVMLGCLAALAAGLYGYSRTDHARKLVVAQINARIPGTLTAGGINILAGGSVVGLENIALQDLHGNVCLAFDSLHLDIRFRSLFDKVLEISRFSIHRPRVNLVVDEAGQVNVLTALVFDEDRPADPETTGRTAPGFPLNVKIRTAQITSGALTFSNPDTRLSAGDVLVEISGVDLLEQTARVSVDIRDVALSHDGRKTDVRHLTVLGALAPDREVTFEIDLDSDPVRLTAAGSIDEVFQNPAVRLELNASSNLAALSSILTGIPDLDGTLNLAVFAQGPVNQPEARAQIRGRNLGVGPDIREAGLDISLNLDRQALVTIEQGQADLLGARVNLTGSADLGPVFPEGFLQPAADLNGLAFQVNLRQADGDFKRLAPWLPGFSGRFSSFVTLQGQGVDPAVLQAEFDLGMGLKDFRQDRATMDFLDLDARVSGTVVDQVCRVDALAVDTPTVQAKGTGWYDLVKEVLEAELAVISDDLAAVARAFDLFPVKGQLTADIQAKGPVTGPDITAALAGQDLSVAGFAADTMDFDGGLTREGVARINRLTVMGKGLDLSAEGTADLFAPGFQIRETIRATLKTSGEVQLHPFFADTGLLPADLPFLDNRIQFDLKTAVTSALAPSVSIPDAQHLTIPATNLAATIDLAQKQLSVNIENLADITASLDMDTGTFNADLSFIGNDVGPLLSAVGIAGIQGSVEGWIRSAGTLQAGLLEPLAVQAASARGRLDISGDISGTAARPDFNASATLSDLAWHLADPDIRVSDLNGRITVSPDHVAVHEITTRINQGRIRLSGAADLSEKGLQNCRLELQAQDLDIPMDTAGTQNKQMTVSRLDTDLSLVLTPPGQIREKAGNDRPQKPQADRLPWLPVAHADARLDLTDTRLDLVLDHTIHLVAGFDPDRSAYDLSLSFDNTLLAPFLAAAGIDSPEGVLSGRITANGNMAGLVPGQALAMIQQAGGTLAFAADVRGRESVTPDQGMDITLTLDGDQLILPVSAAPGSTETLDLTKVTASLDIQAGFFGSAVTGSGGIPGTGAAADAPGGLSGPIPVKTLQAALDLAQPLDLSITVDQATRLTGRLDPATSAFDLNLTFNRTRLDPYLEAAGMPGISMVVSGQTAARGQVNMTLPPQVSDGLTPASGTIRLEADLGGTFLRPDLSAGLFLEGLHYPVPGIGQTLSNLNGSIQVSNDHLTIDRLTADLGRGSLALSGDLELEQFIPVAGQARLTAQNIAFSVEDTLETAFSTDLTFSGTRERTRLSGSVTLLKGEFYRDFEFDLAEALESRKMGAAGPKQQAKTGIPVVGDTRLDIDVDYKEPFVLDNNLAFILVEPGIKVAGTIDQPVITGRAQIVEGTVVYQRRQFDVEKGVIDFVDPFKIDPDITLKAVTQVRQWMIHMEISGRTENLKFRLYSEPAETHEDILSLLIIGKTTGELGQGGASYTGFLTDKASEMIGQGVESATPLDTFQLGVDESAQGGSNVRVTMGKQLSERLKVLYSMKTEEEETVHTNAAEYKMLENVILRAFNDSRGDFGTEVTLKLEFR